jgi:hypothetical protein
MISQTEAAANVFEQVREGFRQTAETTLSAQKELYEQWQKNWSGLVQPQTPWLDQFRQFQRSWCSTVVDLVRKHRETLDRHYQGGIDTLEKAFRLAETEDPDEFRKRAEELCRDSLACLKEMSEAQIREFQDATTKWGELLTKGASVAK